MVVDPVKVILSGVGCWIIAFFVLLFGFRDQLEAHHTTFWLWTCPTAVAIGLLGMPYALRVARRDAAHGSESDHGSESGHDPESGNG
jgi:hypothetical protein